MLTVDLSASFSKGNGTCYSSYPCCLCRFHWRLLRHQSKSGLRFRQNSQPTCETMKLIDCLLAAQTSVVVAIPRNGPGPNLGNIYQTQIDQFSVTSTICKTMLVGVRRLAKWVIEQTKLFVEYMVVIDYDAIT